MSSPILKSTISNELPSATILILLKSVGGAPALKVPEIMIDKSKSMIDVEKYLKNSIKKSNLFLYCGTGFSPTPDQKLDDLFDCFQTRGKLIVYYGLQESYG